MTERKLNETQMREYVENEVRKALLEENINEGLDEGALDFIIQKLFRNDGNPNGIFGKLIKDHMNFPDLLNLAIGIFGVRPLVKWICELLGLEINGLSLICWLPH